jgi:hypothetical protein
VAKRSQANHTKVLVDVASTLMLARSDSRTNAIFVNHGDVPVHLMFGVEACKDEGIRINGNGGSYELSEKNGNLDMRDVYGIVGEGETTILVTEFRSGG